MRRRRFVSLVAATTALVALPAVAQQAKVPLIGWLGYREDGIARDGLWQGLHELGYDEGRNIAIDYRFPETKSGGFAGATEQLARLNVQIILTAGVPAATAVHAAGLTIPVVFVVADPIGSGFAQSLSHPGGNMTGLSLAVEEQFYGKLLQLCKEAAPRRSELAFLWNPANHSSASSLTVMQKLAPHLGLTLVSAELRDHRDIDAVFATLRRDAVQAIIVDTDASMIPVQSRIVAFALASGLPLISTTGRYAEAGGLMSYGPSLHDLWRRAATYVDKILKGAKPADLPIERPAKFELVINLKTAKALGLDLPPTLLAEADAVVE